jgi:hypothetical protein
MKKLLLLFGLILLSAFAYAEVEIDSFKVYIDDAQKNIDWDDDIIVIAPGSKLEIQMRFENHYNETVDINVEGVLYDIGDNLVRTKNIVDLEEDGRETIVLEYYIPSSTFEGEYDLILEYYDSIDGDYEDKSFVVDVRGKEEDMLKLLTNITQELSDSKAQENEYLKALVNLTSYSDAESCKTKLARLEERNNFSSDYKQKFEQEDAQNEDLKEEVAECKADKESMYTRAYLDNEIKKAKKEENRETSNFYLMVLAAAGGFYWWKNKEKKVGGKGEGQSLQGATWG